MQALFKAAVAAAVIAMPIAARAADADTEELRRQIRQLRQDYEARLQALEARLEARSGSAAAPGSETAAAPAAGAPAASAQTAGEPAAVAQTGSFPAGSAPAGRSTANAFNPAISLVLNGRYARLSKDPEGYRLQGFLPAGEEAGPGDKSFSLGESELTLSASVDPAFAGALTFALGDGEVEVEEAKVQTNALGYGLTLKFGRFLSSLGYQNELHAHAWDFGDAPLAYQAFYGGHFKNDGLQLRWLAPSEHYLELGGELGAGSSFPVEGRRHNGADVWTAFARTGADIGDDMAWQLNAWAQRGHARERTFESEDSAGVTVTDAFTGRSDTWGLGLVYKWNPTGNAARQQLKLQGEFFRRTEKGELTYDVDGASLGTASGGYRSAQNGWYLQGVYRFHPLWRVGARYDRLDAGEREIGLVRDGVLSPADLAVLQDYRPRRAGVMLDYSASEFSRLRLQYNRDDTSPDRIDHQIFLQYIMSLGAHGAHAF